MNPLQLLSKLGGRHVQWTAPLPLPCYDIDEVTNLIELRVESGCNSGEVTDKDGNTFKFKCLTDDELPIFLSGDFTI